MFLLSAFADEYATSFEKQLQGLQKNDLHFIELRNADGLNVSQWAVEAAEKFAVLLHENNIKVSSIGSPLGKITADCNMDEYEHTVEHICNVAEVVSCDLIRVFSFFKPLTMSADAYKKAVFNNIERMLLIAQRYNKQLCLENEAHLYGDSPEKCKELLNYFDGELKCCFDMGNFRLSGYDPYPHAYDLLKKYIAYFHIKDALELGEIVPAGCGDAKIRETLCAHQNEYRGDFFVTLEPHLVDFDGLSDLTKEKLAHRFVYKSKEDAFADAVQKFRALMK